MKVDIPRPWSINNWPQATADIAIGAPGTPRVAIIPARHLSINQQKYIANMVAAAPDTADERDRLKATTAELLAALKKWEEYGANNGGEENYTFLAETRAAISKAEKDFTPLRVWTSNNFKGHFGVGTAAVVVAETELLARITLNDVLQVRGLPGVDENTVVSEFDTSKKNALVLNDGDY